MWSLFGHQALLHNGKKISKLDQIELFWLSKKAAVVWHFCLIGNIQNKFLVPRMNESAPTTFIPIQTPDLQIVIYINVFRQTSFLFNLLTIFIWLPMIERANKWKRKIRHFYQYQFRYVFSLYFHLVEIDRYLGGQIELLLSIFFTKWRQYLKQWLKHFLEFTTFSFSFFFVLKFE